VPLVAGNPEACKMESDFLPTDQHLHPAATFPIEAGPRRHYSRTLRSRSALPTTLTEESAMAAAAITGESRIPNTG
jgi:hypothetical protein